MAFSFSIEQTIPGRQGRTGEISTPHGTIKTPAFIPVGTKATVKSVLPDSVDGIGAQAVLANAYHLYLQPGPDVLDEAGGLSTFMNWQKPTFTDMVASGLCLLALDLRKLLIWVEIHSTQVMSWPKEESA